MFFILFDLEILGLLLSVLSIWVVTAVLVVSAVQRITDGEYEIDSEIMLLTSGCAVGLNILWVWWACCSLVSTVFSSDHSFRLTLCLGWSWSFISPAPHMATATGLPPVRSRGTDTPIARTMPVWGRPSSTSLETCSRVSGSCWLPPSYTSGLVPTDKKKNQ